MPRTITTRNDAGATQVVNSYGYKKRRRLTDETTSQPGWYAWPIHYDMDANGHAAGVTTPDGLHVTYAPNALGQPTAVASVFGTHANAITYYPNGAIKQFSYGNGIVHTPCASLDASPA